ncbi:heparin/heparin-sulfate lyase HepB [Duganella violaceipulchra]|uniref:Heparin/heparan-sulfate lyase n=1 Tax=Duganella violaceipulchra TaxID=2849652 RepID=A0AA41HGD9_9BURK|nr:heparin/heparin-sulfate lyase HepB [Duganella violaceicalia]MBV6323691.1 hypothetical protein [Duganella violaceicalia]MCP2007374.1 heparin/heparan-sulfate lyase [Duganella violaceicalia]
MPSPHFVRTFLGMSIVAASAPVLAASFPIDTMIEAEALPENASWTLTNNSTASGGKYMAATTGLLDLSYEVDIPYPGNYKIWIRGLARDKSSNAVRLFTYQTSNPNFVMPKTSDAWQWYATTRVLPKGKQTLKFTPFSENFGLDRIFVTALPSFTPTGVGTNPAALPVTPPAGHPRLFVRSSDLADIRSHFSAPELQLIRKRLDAAVAAPGSGILPPPAEAGKSNFSSAVLASVKAKALYYLLDGNQASGAQAVTMMTDFINTISFNVPDDDGRPRGDTILTTAIVYDWCYPLLSTEQRQLFIDKFVEIAGKMEIGFPPSKQGSVTGHGSETLLMRDQLGAAIAFYDEAPAIYQLVAGRFFADYIEPRNYAYPSHAHHQGVSYGPVRYIGDMFASWIFRRMGSANLFDPAQQMTPYHWIYMRRPDGQFLRDGDVYHSYYMQYRQYWSEPMPYLLASSYYSDPMLKHEMVLQQKVVEQLNVTSAALDDIWHVLFRDTQLPEQVSQSLPLTKYFPEPYGMMVARTGWTDGVNMDSGAVVASMKIGSVQYRNHQHLDAGQFQIYYKGGLATASGIYEGLAENCPGVKNCPTQGYGGLHDMNYQKRTIAHNSLLIFDPAETFQTSGNDGGQRWVNPQNRQESFSQADLLGTSPADVLRDVPVKDSSIVASVLKHDFGPDPVIPDYSYLKGDLTNAYSAKVSEVKRSFVFLNLKNTEHPAALIVFDKITSTNDSFTKTWLLHSQSQPQIVGDTVTIKRVDATVGYNGQLVNRTLLPAGANAVITAVGGTGNEYRVQGSNYPIYAANVKNTEEAGAWRIEISPATKAAADTFLNVMQVMDATGRTTALPATAVVSDLLSGVQIQDRAVLFSKDSKELDTSASFTLSASSLSVQVLVTDLSAGIWSVAKLGGQPVQYEVKPEAGTLYFTAPGGGDYVLQRGAVSHIP